MNNEKQIIIDGVDVSGCEYACNTAFGKNGCKHPMMKNILCYKNPKCYFKQLARKTQECEELKEEIEALEKINRRNDQELLRRLTYASNAEKQRDRYRKALEEIEGIVKDWYKNEWSCYMCRKNMDKKLEDILDIINKAKGR